MHIWLPSSMDFHMCAKIKRCKISLTHWIHTNCLSPVCVIMCGVGLEEISNCSPHYLHSYCSCVCPHVFGTVSRLTEQFATQSAFIWLVSCVYPHVCGKATRLSKLSATLCTFIWLLSCVCPHVSGKIAG